jgi:cardiolipin synthase
VFSISEVQWQFIVLGLIILNTIFAFLIIYLNRRYPTVTLLWLAILALIPIFGFFVFLLIGHTHFKDKRFSHKAENDRKLKHTAAIQLQELEKSEVDTEDPDYLPFLGMVRMLILQDDALLTKNNHVKVYSDGNEKFDDLFRAIANAKEHIHIEYYIIRNDDLGKKLVTELAKKAREGVEVRLLYDGVGCKALPGKFFGELKDAGGEVVGFFERWLGVYVRINHRNHRKIAVIDGKTAFVGGYNIGVEYLGQGPLGNWRDAAVRIKGHGAMLAQIRFMLDWGYETGKLQEYDPKYFPPQEEFQGAYVQIVSSGPDSFDEKIKHAYIKMIASAKESVYIQTPYFVPDPAVADALRIAAMSGVDVRIMIPCKPDHMFIYWAGYGNIGWLKEKGVRAFKYDDGFIHAKTIVVDGLVGSVGSANWDVRSFKLNFETQAFVYDRDVGADLKRRFEEDIEKRCSELTKEMYDQRGAVIKMKETLALLFSDLL